jgi:hypothetical protein
VRGKRNESKESPFRDDTTPRKTTSAVIKAAPEESCERKPPATGYPPPAKPYATPSPAIHRVEEFFGRISR